jgi:hypothetical protein
MATQGIVSLVRDGHVVAKVIAGCNGQEAENLATAIRQSGVQGAQEIYDLAISLHFGCEDCLVVMDRAGVVSGEMEIGELYSQTFDQPEFNPRWNIGIADFVEVVEAVLFHQYDDPDKMREAASALRKLALDNLPIAPELRGLANALENAAKLKGENQ